MNTERLYNYAITWIEDKGPSILLAILIFFIGQWLIRVVKKILRHSMENREVSSSLRPFFISLVTTTLQVLLVILIFQVVGIQLTIFAAIVTSFGVAAGLALSGTLQNFTGGVLILLLRPFKVGDNIIAQGHDGIVDSIEIFYTIITTFDNRTVIIPNSKLSNEVIVNISRQGSRRLDINLKLSYQHDIETVREILMQTITSFPEVLQEPAPYVGVLSLDPDGYKIEIEVWLAVEKYQETKFNLQQKAIHDLKAAGIKLPGM
jgi:small conductance mechanosensitive channel